MNCYYFVGVEGVNIPGLWWAKNLALSRIWIMMLQMYKLPWPWVVWLSSFLEKHTSLLNVKIIGFIYEQLVIKYIKGAGYVKEAIYINMSSENMILILWIL